MKLSTGILGAACAIAVFAVAAFFYTAGWPLIRSAFVADAAPACSADKFEIESHSGRLEGGRLVITGAVRNNNSSACGVQVNVAIKDGAGKVFANESLWVAGVYNILPGKTQSFPLYLPREVSKQAQDNGYDIRPIDARVWKQQ